jgi:DnaJ-class molecular chaperone
MPKRWHREGCGQETWEERCPHCDGRGYLSPHGFDKLVCYQCDGKKVVCGACMKPY